MDADDSPTISLRPKRRGKGAVAYTAALLTCVLITGGICRYGECMRPAAAPRPETAAAKDFPLRGTLTSWFERARAVVVGGPRIILHVALTWAAVVLLGRILGRGMRSCGQPPVIGEVLAGILLGPSCLGAIAPPLMHALVPAVGDPGHDPVLFVLQGIAQGGIVGYMFLVGLELDLSRLQSQARVAVAVSHLSIAVPFVLGTGLALGIYPEFAGAGVSFTTFALFLGAALSITAFPVLARILSDRGLEKTDVGIFALGCAASGDATAWCLLAGIVGVARGESHAALGVLGGAVAYLAGMFFLVRPWLVRWGERVEQRLSPWALPLLVVAVLISAATTAAIGIHAVFGAFLLGALFPHESRLVAMCRERLERPITALLLPAFFAATGMETEIGLITGTGPIMICLATIALATVGKVGGTLCAARCAGRSWRISAVLGALMNTRGLMELIVLNVGLSLGVISSPLFAMLVLMAMVTTVTTAPALGWLLPGRSADLHLE